MTHCCADCGVAGGGVSLKTCKSCMSVKYCNAACQKNHWPKHKKDCKHRAAELHDEALFKDPPAKEDCPICFLPMPVRLLSCASLPDATISSVPLHDFAIAHQELATIVMEQYYQCCGKSICGGCVHSFCKSGNINTCPFCNADGSGKTSEERVEEMMKRVEVNDAGAMSFMGNYYLRGGKGGFMQDQEKAKELLNRAAKLGSKEAHFRLGNIYSGGDPKKETGNDYRREGELKKAKFHYEAAAMAGHELARLNIGIIENESGNRERAVKHWIIAASAGQYNAMYNLMILYKHGQLSTNAIEATLTAYNNSCAEMRSEARDAYILYGGPGQGGE